MKSCFKILSGAGCGKTTYLLGELDNLFRQGVQPEDVVFTTFTRKGANEALERAMRQFGFRRSRLPWFRTLHSLCWHFTQDAGKIMGANEWLEVGRRTGEHLTVQRVAKEDLSRALGVTKGDRMVNLWNKARLLMRDPEEVFAEQGDVTMHLTEFRNLIRVVGEVKAECECLDFTDILEEFMRRPVQFAPSYVLVDEMQDTAPLQWECIKKLAGNAHLYMAGDDDQCIYEYAGAVPDILIDTPGRSHTLPRSHRLPVAVHALAGKITERIRKRIPKDIRCRPDPGRVEWVVDPCMLDMRKGSWLLLARNNMMLDYLEDCCTRMALPYVGGTRSAIRPAAWRGVRSYMALLRGETLTMEAVKEVYALLKQNRGFTRGFKKAVNDADDDATADMAALRADFGLLADGKWSDELRDGLTEQELAFLSALDKRGELDADPRVTISTIHGVKGGEADNVVLLTDMTAATHAGMAKSPDTEHRVWYVGVTRARHALFAVRPFTGIHYDLPL